MEHRDHHEDLSLGYFVIQFDLVGTGIQHPRPACTNISYHLGPVFSQQLPQ